MEICRKGLKLGGSKHWSEALMAITGDEKMNAHAILEYFKPLHDFLTIENQRLAKEDDIRQNLSKYNEEASIQCQKLQIADWDKTTDLNNITKAKIYAQAVAENARFTKSQYQLHFSHLHPNDFTDEKVRRQVQLIGDLGQNALDETRLLELTDTISEMVKIYNKAEFCAYGKANCTKHLTLDPGKYINSMLLFSLMRGFGAD